MGRTGALVFTAFLGTALPGTTLAQSPHDIVGMWSFVSSMNEQAGKKTDTYGPGATGIMVLDSSGRYTLTIIGAGLPKFSSNNRTTATSEESRAVLARANSHFGSYTANPHDMTITFKIESSTFPNWNGTEQKRNLRVNGDELQYSVAASSVGGSSVVTWRRVR